MLETLCCPSSKCLLPSFFPHAIVRVFYPLFLLYLLQVWNLVLLLCISTAMSLGMRHSSLLLVALLSLLIGPSILWVPAKLEKEDLLIWDSKNKNVVRLVSDKDPTQRLCCLRNEKVWWCSSTGMSSASEKVLWTLVTVPCPSERES